MTKSTARKILACATMLLIAKANVAAAAQIKVMSAEALKTAMVNLVEAFEHASGDTVTVVYGTAGVIKNRIERGESADVVVLPESALAPLVKDGKLAEETKIAHSPLALAVKLGAPKPQIGTVDALKRTLLEARSITYPDPTKGGAIGVQAARLIERLGLTEQLKAKTILTPAGEFLDLLASGKADIAIAQPVVVVNHPGIDLVGTLPAEVQDNKGFEFMASIAAQGKASEAGKAFVDYLHSPAAARLIKTAGLEPE